MRNDKLQQILVQYPNECEIQIMGNDYKNICQICAEYDEDDDFTTPNIIIYV